MRINRINNLAIFAALVLLIILGAEYAVAKEYPVEARGKTIVAISPQGVNRISVDADRIARIIGNEAEYIIDSDGDLGQIFLTPSLKAGQQINVTMVTEQGRQIDARLDVTNIPPQTVLFKFKSNHSGLANFATTRTAAGKMTHTNDQGLNDKQNVIELIRAVRAGTLTGSNIPKLSSTCQHKALKFVRGSEYHNDQYSLTKLTIENNSEQKIRLEESEFEQLRANIVAIALEINVLESKASTILYLVARND